jgi:hypothetical protein
MKFVFESNELHIRKVRNIKPHFVNFINILYSPNCIHKFELTETRPKVFNIGIEERVFITTQFYFVPFCTTSMNSTRNDFVYKLLLNRKRKLQVTKNIFVVILIELY